LLAEGKTNKEIANELELVEATVKMHVTAIMRALDVNNRTQAVVVAERLGLK
jgi:DNA-binding NarL/FixJ family response regulator